MWVPGHVGIRGNEAADRAAKEALNRKTDSRSHVLFGPKTFNCQISLSIWQKDWDEIVLVSNKFNKILPKLPDKLTLGLQH